MQSREKKPSKDRGGWGITIWGDWRTIVMLAISTVLVSIAVRGGLTPDQIGILIGAAVKKAFGLP
jgi:hypothetical protein